MEGGILISKLEERISLDKKNQQILQMLIDNSRIPVSKIAKKLKLSKPAVMQRIKNMQDKKIILQYITYFNLIFTSYKLHIILLKTDNENEPKYSEILSKNKFTAGVVQLASKFNLMWMIFSKDSQHFNQILTNITKTIKIKDMKIFPIIENYFDNYKLFGNAEKNLNISKPSQTKLDKKDAKILNVLKDNSRETLVNIAKDCNLTAEAVNQRIKKLKEKGIILSFFTNFDIFRFGFQPYLVMIKTNRQKQDEILKFIRKHKNSNGQYLLDNDYDLMGVIVIKDLSELKDFIEKLNFEFKDQILDYQTYLLTNQIFSDFFPQGIYEDILKEN